MADHGIERDDGFTVVEIVLAASLMFFVLTALFGLIGVSQSMAVSAKERTTLTSGLAYYADQWRLASFASISATNPPASDSLQVGSADGTRTITISNTYNAVMDPSGASVARKEITINATLVGKNGKTYQMQATVAYNNPDTNVVSTQQSGGADNPVVSWVSPPDGSVIYGNQIYGGGNIILDARASSSSHLIASEKFTLANQGTPISSGGQSASQSNIGLAGPPDFKFPTTGNSWYWDTTNPSLSDGLQGVTFWAFDDNNGSNSVDRTFVIDNVPPAAIPSLQVAAQTTTYSVTASWTAPHDAVGTPYYAAQYRYRVFADAAGVSDISSWNATSGTSGSWPNATPPAAILPIPSGTWVQEVQAAGPINAQIAVMPFSRYYLQMQPGGPRTWPADWNSTVTSVTPFVSRPVATGSYKISQSGNGANKVTAWTVAVDCDKPTFSTSSITYTLQVSPDLVTWTNWLSYGWQASPAATQAGPLTVSGKSEMVGTGTIKTGNGSVPGLYMRTAVTLTPSGWKGGASQTVYTNAVGPTASSTTSATVSAAGW